MVDFKRDIDPNKYFKFSFLSPGMSRNMAHFVLTDDINLMYLFLKQHNFDINEVEIEIVDRKEHEGDDEFLLSEVIAKSNYSDETFTLITTEHLVYDASNWVCSQLSSSLTLGPHIIRDDVKIMGVISELVNELPHVYVLDHTLVDPQTLQPFSDNYDRWTKVGIGCPGFPNDTYFHDDCAYDDSGIYESMTYSIIPGYHLPYTIEAYVSYFVSLLTDVYNG